MSWLTGGDEDASDRQVEQWRQWYRDDLSDRQRRELANKAGVKPPSGGGGGGGWGCVVLAVVLATAATVLAGLIARGVIA